jgi:hypothetical protein
MLTSHQTEQIGSIFQEFIKGRYKKVRKLSLDSLQINPLFLRQLAEHLQWTNAREIVQFLVDETFQRGIVTSAGFRAEQIVKVFGEPTAVRGIDVEKRKPRPGGGTDVYYIQVKAGPNTIHGDTQRQIEEKFDYVLRRNPRAIPLLGITYGDASRANSFTRRLMDRFQVLFGRDFWAFISDDPDCMNEIYRISIRVATTYKPTYRGRPVGKSLQQLLDDKIDEITHQWEATYGSFGPQMWENLL